jgi:hypothetical protein
MSRAIPLLVLLLFALPGTAQARTLTGKTAQGKGIRVVTYRDGAVKRITANWKAACAQGGSYNGSTLFRPSYSDATQDGVMIVDSYGVRPARGYRGTVSVQLRGTKAGKGMRGTLAVSVKVRRGGRTVDTCTLAATAWTAGHAAPAGPAKRYVGTGSQKRVVTVTTHANGVVSSVRIAWQAHCGDGTVFHETTVFASDLDTATTDAVGDTGSYSEKGPRGERYRVSLFLSGSRVAASPERWEGALAVKIVITKHGKHETNCTLKSASWSADLL